MQIVQHYITALINLAVRNAFENINKYKQLDYTTDASLLHSSESECDLPPVPWSTEFEVGVKLCNSVLVYPHWSSPF